MKAEFRIQNSEFRRQKAEGRRQKAEGRRMIIRELFASFAMN
jgi:hypothetical protein